MEKLKNTSARIRSKLSVSVNNTNMTYNKNIYMVNSALLTTFSVICSTYLQIMPIILRLLFIR